jgi:hypothetical protein
MKISVTLRMYMTRGDSVQRTLTNGLRGWPASQIPRSAGQLLCRFGLRLL